MICFSLFFPPMFLYECQNLLSSPLSRLCSLFLPNPTSLVISCPFYPFLLPTSKVFAAAEISKKTQTKQEIS